MLVQIGARAAAGDVVDRLLACHARIRKFLDLAARLAAARGVAAGEVCAAAGQVRRYFAEALPLHIADEDELILPRLAGRSAALDEALATMRADHNDHAGRVDRLIALTAELSRAPAQLADRAGLLADATEALRSAFEPHLALEERTIFPALARLPAGERDAIEAEMRRRRSLDRTASGPSGVVLNGGG